MGKQKQVFLLIFLVALLVIVNYSFLDDLAQNALTNKEPVFVTRIIDGDTIETSIGTIRLMGVNSPEKGEEYYLEAKEFLENRILNRTVFLEKTKTDKDKYQRLLRYVFLGTKNIDAELVENGFANVYYLDGKDVYSEKLFDSWEDCLEKEINLCEKSQNVCAPCVKLKELDVAAQEAVFVNVCEFDCDLENWKIKDEGRKKFIFENFVLEKNSEVSVVVGEGTREAQRLFWAGEDYVWTSSGDTLFLRDDSGKLVLWKNY